MNKTETILSRYVYENLVDLIIQFAFKCNVKIDLFKLGYYEKCVTALDDIYKLKLKSKYNLKLINSMLNQACHSGHIEIVNLIMKYGVDNWNEGLCGACHYGNIEIVKFLIKF